MCLIISTAEMTYNSRLVEVQTSQQLKITYLMQQSKILWTILAFGSLMANIWVSCNEVSKWAFLSSFSNWWKPLKPKKMASLHDELAIGVSVISGCEDGESEGDDSSSNRRRDGDSDGNRWRGYQQRRSTAVEIGRAGISYTHEGVIDHRSGSDNLQIVNREHVNY